ncbi:hypothetical protein N7488_009817 [Penicillium malachiteum]|nr:hypothetical protein N7488_009817 [Penicillium malachiteum]
MGLAHWSYSGDRYIRSSDRKTNNVTSFTVELPKANSSSTVQAKSSDLRRYISSSWLFSQHTTLHVSLFTPLIMVAAMTIVPRFGSFNLFSPFVRNMAG